MSPSGLLKRNLLEIFRWLVTQYVSETNEWGLADLGRAALEVRVYGSAAISFGQGFIGSSLTYITYLQPWDYAAASILGESLGYRLLTVSGEPADFKRVSLS